MPGHTNDPSHISPGLSPVPGLVTECSSHCSLFRSPLVTPGHPLTGCLRAQLSHHRQVWVILRQRSLLNTLSCHLWHVPLLGRWFTSTGTQLTNERAAGAELSNQRQGIPGPADILNVSKYYQPHVRTSG